MRNTIIIILILIIVGFGALWYTRNTAVPNQYETDGNGTYVEAGVKYQKYWSADYGVSFAYRLSPDGYILISQDTAGFPDKTVEKYMILFNEREYNEMLALKDPHEGPPAISVTMFKNPTNEDAATWLNSHGFAVNYRKDGTVVSPVEIGGVKGVRYVSDGLYQDDVVILNNNYRIYVFIGSFNAPEDKIHKDFADLLKTVTFF